MSVAIVDSVEALPQALPSSRPSLKAPLDVRWASSEDDVRDVQRLRYEVFVEEMGATLSPPDGTPLGLDADRFDPFCDHLMVRARPEGDDAPPGPLLGTYRVMSPGAARRAGGLYADTEFDLAPLQALRGQAVELGRACVHKQARSGGVIMALWAALGRYMAARQLQTMIGCVSVSVVDGGQAARQIWRHLSARHMAEHAWQVRPRKEFPLSDCGDRDAVPRLADIPPLIKGYVRCGARLLGPPAYDSAFNTADIPLMLRVEEMDSRYRRHFIASKRQGPRHG